ncbi:MAG: class I SAM-dependent methyltransferase [Streptomycetaceae bacterium]|jgi:predicted TPR repeat methyltransferase|nr:MAG: class I SAM-dependent methyltransferase [Streptomycetaceae bacterium]
MSDEALGLDEAYSVQSPDDNRRLYAKWAATYESSFVDAKQYRYPKAIAEVFNDEVDAVTRVLDIGTGTGLTGMYVSRLRPGLVIDGMDISPEMLAQARLKTRADASAVYRELYVRDLTESVENENKPYEALFSSGTFTHGHLGPQSLRNLLPLLANNGWLIVGVNNEHFEAKGFAEELDLLVALGAIKTPIIKRIDVYEPGSVHYGDQARVIITRVII